MSDNRVHDLDALVPASHIVKLHGKEITVNPPRMSDILRIGALGARMQKPEDLTSDELTKLEVDMREIINSSVPELKDEELNSSQVLKLVEIISGMGAPPEPEIEGKKVEVPKANP